MPNRPEPRSTITEAIDDLRAGRRSCVDLLKDCLERIDAREEDLRAWVVLDRAGALEQARQRDAELAEGRWRGPLQGIPIGVKDNINVAGLPCAGGSLLWADQIAESDAPIVARLRSAGAVILGKTVTTPYAWSDPPATKNPWNLERTPGGSSSGSAAALASGMCLGALGTQTGGSIIRPSSFCGLSGLKPTFGRLETEGIIPLSQSLDHAGPIARNIADLALMWQALRPEDPPALASDRPPRLGRLSGAFQERAEPSALEALERALATFRDAGATVQEPTLPEGFENVWLQHRVIVASEAAFNHEARADLCPEDYPERISALIDEGRSYRAPSYLYARDFQRRLKSTILDCFQASDVLVTPSTIGPAPDPSTTGDPLFNAPWSLTGLPTVCFPIGLSTEGLPLGLQLIGKPGDEVRLLGIALWCERLLGDPLRP